MGNVSVPIAVQRKEEILQRLAQGELVRNIAKDLGIHRMSISHVLANDPEYQAAIAEALEARLEMADEALERAEDGLSLARAREQHVAARWRAERLNPAKYGAQKQAVAIQTEGPAKIMVVSYADPQTPSD